MEQAIQVTPDSQDELTRRHRAAARVVRGLFALTLALVAVAFIGKKFIPPRENPPLDIALRIAILIFGLGAIALRRTRFMAMRLQDVAALGGIHGLLVTLQRTTVQVALLGGAIVVLGFIATLMTGNDFYTLGAGLVTIAVLLYCYPRRNAWQRVVHGIQESGDANDPPVKGRAA